jgi:hypothetical protein
MNDSKLWWQSRTVWGGLIAAFAGLASVAGLSLTDVDQTQLADAACAIASAVGGVLAIYGRVRATKPIAVTPSDPKTS